MTQSPPSGSRLIKREKQKLFKQTAWAVTVAVGLILLFIFYGIPNVPRVLGLIVGNGSEVSVIDDLPPQVPSLYITQRFTNKKTLEIQGSTQDGSFVVIKLNGVDLPAFQAGQDGSFSQSVELEEGENMISAYSYNKSNNPSLNAKVQTIVLDSVVPELKLAEGITSEMSVIGKNKQYFMITAQTKPGAKITINDRFLFAKESGEFSYRYRLSEGDNLIKIQVEDKAGNQMEQELKISFRP